MFMHFSFGSRQRSISTLNIFVSILHDQVPCFADNVLSAEYERALLAAGTLTVSKAGPIELKPFDGGQGHLGRTALVQQLCFIFGIEAAIDHPAAVVSGVLTGAFLQPAISIDKSNTVDTIVLYAMILPTFG